MACFDMLLAFTNDNALAMGGALLLALICVALIRLVTVLVTSFVGSFLIVSLTGKVFTGLVFLQLGENDVAVIIALGLGLFLTIVQLISARYYQAR